MIKLKDSSLYRVAPSISLLSTITKPSFYGIAKEIVDVDHPRVSGYDGNRIFFIVHTPDGDEADIVEINLEKRLDSQIDIDTIITLGDTFIDITNPLDVDEIITKNLIALGWAAGDSLVKEDKNGMDYYLTVISGFCVAALNDPDDIVLSFKHFTVNGCVFLGIDWVWYRPREN